MPGCPSRRQRPRNCPAATLGLSRAPVPAGAPEERAYAGTRAGRHRQRSPNTGNARTPVDPWTLATVPCGVTGTPPPVVVLEPPLAQPTNSAPLRHAAMANTDERIGIDPPSNTGLEIAKHALF